MDGFHVDNNVLDGTWVAPHDVHVGLNKAIRGNANPTQMHQGAIRHGLSNPSRPSSDETEASAMRCCAKHVAVFSVQCDEILWQQQIMPRDRLHALLRIMNAQGLRDLLPVMNMVPVAVHC